MCECSTLPCWCLREMLTPHTIGSSVNAPGVAADISHINTPSVVNGYLPADGGLEKALKGSDIIVIPAGVPRKPGMTRDDLFNVSHRSSFFQ